MIDFEGDVKEQEAQGPSDEALRKVATLTNRQLELEDSVAELERQLKQEKERLRKVAEVELPELLQNEIGLTMFALADGTGVEIKDSLKCNIPKKNAGAVAEWLRENGHGALVKQDLLLPFDKGEAEKVKQITELLEEHGFSQYQINEAVHTGQLKSLIKELEEEGEDVPLSLFGAYHHKAAKITRKA